MEKITKNPENEISDLVTQGAQEIIIQTNMFPLLVEQVKETYLAKLLTTLKDSAFLIVDEGLEKRVYHEIENARRTESSTIKTTEGIKRASTTNPQYCYRSLENNTFKIKEKEYNTIAELMPVIEKLGNEDPDIRKHIEKKDFGNWARTSLKEPELADKLDEATTAEEVTTIMQGKPLALAIDDGNMTLTNYPGIEKMNITEALKRIQEGDLKKYSLIIVSEEFRKQTEKNKGPDLTYRGAFKKTLEDLLNKKRVLVVDHNDLILDECNEILKKEGYVIHTSRDGEQAYQQVMKMKEVGRKYDVVVCSFSLPGINGIKLAERIPTSETTTIMLYSEFADLSTMGMYDRRRESATNAGIFEMIEKADIKQKLAKSVQQAIKLNDRRASLSTDPEKQERNPKEIWIEESLKETPDNPSLLFERAILYQGRGKHDEAISDLERVVQIEPKNAAAHYRLGLSYFEKDAEAGKVISLFRKATEIDQNFIEAYFSLGEVYDSIGDCKNAGENFFKAIEKIAKWDPEGRINFDYSKADIRDMKEAGGVLVDITQHKVMQVVPRRYMPPDIILKFYEKEDQEKAAAENRNLTILNQKGVKEKLMHPDGSAILIPQSRLYTKKADETNNHEYSFLRLDRMKGERLSNEIARLSERKGEKETLIRHLEWVVDHTAILQHVATKEIPKYDEQYEQTQTKLQDIRQKKHQLGNKPRTIGFYTKRFAEKFMGQAQAYGGISIGSRYKKKLLAQYNEINDGLYNIPDFLYLFYTDANLRNFLIERGEEFKAGMYLSEPQRISRSNKTRLDLEGNDIRCGVSDVITAIEHEFCMGPNKLSKEDIKYLTHRWLLGIVRMDMKEKGKDASNIDTILKENKREEVDSSIRENIRETDQALTLPRYDQICKLAAAERHLTIVGDKMRDNYKRKRVLEMQAEKYDFVRDYEQQVARQKIIDRQKFIDEKRDYVERVVEAKSSQKTPQTEEAETMLSYLQLKDEHSRNEEHMRRHVDRLGELLNELGMSSFRKKLNSYYGLWKERKNGRK